MRSNKQNRIEHVAVVTGTRAEYGILKPLLTKIEKDPNLELSLLVTGLHVLKEFGRTISEIKKDGFKITAEIPMYPDDLFWERSLPRYRAGGGC